MRNIQSIKVLRNTVYINFDNGRFGTHTIENGKWIDAGITKEELKAAQKLGIRDGKWKSWRKPAGLLPDAPTNTHIRKDEEQLDQEAWDRVKNEERFYAMTH